MRSTRITGLDVGLVGVDRWRHDDDVHLPETKQTAASYMPETRPLDAILRPPTLDERLATQLVPSNLSPDLLDPTVMSATRERLRDRMDARAAQASPAEVEALDKAAAFLDEEIALDAEITEALTILLKG